eukprot:TRINITY_DN36024_c0_g1_i2.p1 TRINITY_DN36024_c0_g1~~TRINITY_DN36024_c0_g1_i2.p1  ORF type:complete len:544 (-),score=133.47 TRINITY_DN36024_c0_g1_i2:370-2001(-)
MCIRDRYQRRVRGTCDDPMDKEDIQKQLNGQVADQVERLRAAFNTGMTRSYSYRIAQLQAFQLMMKDNCDRWTEALHKDLRKNKFESYNMEVNPVEHEIQWHLDQLAAQMEPVALAMDPIEHPVISMTGHGKAALYRDPLGVCLVIGAWNYPLHLTLLPVVGAIAAGNTVCIKTPSPKYSPATASLIAELAPKYLENVEVVEGGAEGTTAVLQPRFDHIFFTGGSFVGKLVAEAAARHLTPTVLELGGKSPVIVDRSASLSVTAKRLMWGKMTNAGQTCVAADHVYVHADVADQFVQACEQAVREFYGDSPQDSQDLARIINGRAWDKLSQVVEDGRGFIAFGGDMDKSDLYIAPTLMNFGGNVKAFEASLAMKDEIFGPILPVVQYTDLEKDVISKISSQEKPLAMYIFTNDFSVSEKLLRETTAGHCVVNDILLQFCAPLPFGGIGNSGMGSYHREWSYKTFTHEKGVLKRHVYGEIPARFPPYNVKWKNFLVSALTYPFSHRVVRLVKLVLLFVFLKYTPAYSVLAPIAKSLLLSAASFL